MSLARYISHKTIRAAKIVSVNALADPVEWKFTFYFRDEEGCMMSTEVDADWVISRVFKGKLSAKNAEDMALQCEGGYYVEYEDGYTSWSPAKAFEDGYTPAPAQPVRGEVNPPFPPPPFRPIYRQLHAEESDAVASIKDKAADLWDALNAASTLPNVDPRCIAYARTKLEEHVMWATKAVTK